MKLTCEKFAEMVDAVAIAADQTFEHQKELAEASKQYGFYLIFGQASFYPFLIDQLKGYKTLVGGGVGSGNGTERTEQKIFAAKRFIELGCADIDMWMNISAFRAGLDDLVYDDIKAVREVVPSDHVLKVIIEAPLLTKEEIKRACDIIAAAKADFVKSGTGNLGATTIEIAQTMIEGAAGRLKVKCAGGIRDVITVQEMFDMGVDRIGMGYNSAINIYKQLAGRS